MSIHDPRPLPGGGGESQKSAKKVKQEEANRAKPACIDCGRQMVTESRDGMCAGCRADFDMTGESF